MFYTLHIFASDQIKEEGNKTFLFFGATFEHLLSQKASFDISGATFKQLSQKLRETF